MAAEVESFKIQVTAKDAEIATLNETVQNITIEKDLALSFKEKAESVDKGKREEAKRLHNILKGDKTEQAFLTAIDSMEITAVETLISDYTSQVENSFPMTCQDCHSKNVSRASNTATTPPVVPTDLRTKVQENARMQAVKTFTK